MRQTLRGCNALGVAQFDSLRLHEIEQPLAVSAHVSVYFGERWQFLAFGLADVEHVHRSKTDQSVLWLAFIGCIVGVNFGRDCVLARPTIPDHRGKNEDAFFSALNESAKRVPCTDSGYVGGVRLLSGNQH